MSNSLAFAVLTGGKGLYAKANFGININGVMKSESVMKKIKSNIDTGHILTIIILVFGIAGSSITTYYTIKFTGQNNTIQIQRLNRKVQETNNKISNMDDIYVRQKEFDNFKNNVSNKLENIDKNVNYLIRLQIEKSKQ